MMHGYFSIILYKNVLVKLCKLVTTSLLKCVPTSLLKRVPPTLRECALTSLCECLPTSLFICALTLRMRAQEQTHLIKYAPLEMVWKKEPKSNFASPGRQTQYCNLNVFSWNQCI